MKKRMLPLSLLLLMFTFLATGQDTKLTQPYRQLVITEFRCDNHTNAYLEVTNIGNTAVNLSDFWFIQSRYGYPPHQPEIIFEDTIAGTIENMYWPNALNLPEWNTKGPDQVLQPGNSFVFSNVYDGLTPGGNLIHDLELMNESDLLIHYNEPDNDETIYESSFPEYNNFDFDSVSPFFSLLYTGHSSAIALMHVYYDEEGNIKDSATVDVVNFALDENNMRYIHNDPIAGVSEATSTHIMHRKSSVTQGNLNWNDSRGVSSQDSEWMVVPVNRGKIYTSVGNHGDYSIDIQSDKLSIDMENEVITVPWETQKGDSIIMDMQLGEGMGWQYIEDTTSYADSAHTICRDGDILTLYAMGDELQTMSFLIDVEEPKDNIAAVFPLRNQNFDVVEGEGTVWGNARYYVTEKKPGIDTIGDVEHATRVDTLFKYLEKADNASWEIIWVDGTERVDLKYGDKLLVTAGDGTTTKEYFIDVQEYEKNNNATLGAILWPDRPDYLDPLIWSREDTIPGFSNNIFIYNILLPYETDKVPSLVAKPWNENSTVTIETAKGLIGNPEDRTTTIRITAESDTTTQTYKVQFSRRLPDMFIQPFVTEPFISEIVCNQGAWNGFVEMYNPGNQPLDMSQYMFVITKDEGKTPAEAIEGIIPRVEANYSNRYMHDAAYIPGYKWPATEEVYNTNPGVMVFDPAIDPIVEPSDVFVIAGSEWNDHRLSPQINRADAILTQTNNFWGEENLHRKSMIKFMRGNKGFYIFKIKNDSILLGTKPIGDPADFELIEFFGTLIETNDYQMAGRSFDQNDRLVLRRKPHVFKPCLDYECGWGTNAKDSDWIVIKMGDTYNGIEITNNALAYDIGSHIIDPVTAYISTVNSFLYDVDDGYEGDLFIKGVSDGETVQQFMDNLIKADTGQSLKVLSTDDGSEKGMDDPVVENDTLWVQSADSVNITRYVISTIPLDDDAVLTAVDGSDIEIQVDGETGTITGFGYDVTLKAILENVNVPTLATLYVKDGTGQLVPLTMINNDTIKVDAKVAPDLVFEVTAQDNRTVITYDLQPALGENKAFVNSDVYDVDQELMLISLIDNGTSVDAFIDNLIIPEGAKVTLYDKADFEREMGQVKFDDYLVVTSADDSEKVTYFLQFLQEPKGLTAYVVSEVLTVLQETLEIMNLTTGTTVEELINVLTPSPQATFAIVNASDEAVTSGEVLEGFKVVVTSGNGAVTNTYTIDIVTSTEEKTISSLTLYPNPVREFLYVNNLETNSTVIIKNMLGQTMMVQPSLEVHDGINVTQLPEGVYILIIQKNNQQVGMMKFVKKN
jgi:hypothetical protein